MPGITQWYRGQLIIGSGTGAVRIPVLPGATLAMPENYEFPGMISNLQFQVNFSAGLTFPTLEIPVAVTNNWFTATNLNAWFITRTADDLSAMPDVTLWDGASGVMALGVKGARLRLTITKGALVGAHLTLVGRALTRNVANPGLADDFRLLPARSQHCSITVGANNLNPINLTFVIDNQVTPNPEVGDTGNIDAVTGGVHPSEINAGQLVVNGAVVMQAHNLPPADGTDFSVAITPPGATAAVTFALKNPLWQGRDTFNLGGPPRQVRQFTFICRGGATGQAPIVIS